MTVKKVLRLGIGIMLAMFFIWLIARQVNLDELSLAFSGTSISWLIAGFFAFTIGYACRIERWRLMLLRDNSDLSWRQCAGPLLTSFAANNVLPFRAGDVLRAFAFNSRLGVSSGVVVATLFVERLLDLLMVLIVLCLVLTIFDQEINGFAGIGVAALLAISTGILFLLLFPQLFAPVAITAGKLVRVVAPKLGGKLLAEINKSVTTLIHLARKGIMLRLVVWSATTWLAEGCVFWFTALALSSITTPSAGWLALPIGTLATLIPSTPGYVGTFDYFTIQAMSSLGNNAVASTAYALLVHVLLWFPPTIVGGIYLLLQPIKNPK